MKRILISNRGEIACRIIRSAHALGYETVAVYSDADRGAPHVQQADLAVHIGAAAAAESYLNVERILKAAKDTGADAVHPGYGFLAENEAFARACLEAGLTFIGPPPEAIRLMGSKRQSKLRMQAAGVPVVPGYSEGDQDPEVLLAEAKKIGLPLMVKASAGGGGRGLRLVTEAEQVPGALAAARAEALASFSDGELILERAIMSARHVEIQVFADRHGNVLHLGERDCSVQRRHQKVIEEAPSPAVQQDLRDRMGQAATSAARAIGYEGAGTVEMLLTPDGEFFFMEMNTRLQVEHPVTEMVTGQDLVAWQLDVAAGRRLPMAQEDLRMQGHAVEARLYAEDAYGGFLPQVGVVRRLRWPKGPGVRIDHGIQEGQEVTTHYDAMVAKIIAHGRDRDEALQRLTRALRQTQLHGLVSNRGYLLSILDHPEFRAGKAHTDFIETHLAHAEAPSPSDQVWALAGLLMVGADGQDYWRSTGVRAAPARLVHGAQEHRLQVEPEAGGGLVKVGESTVQVSQLQHHEGLGCFECEGVTRKFAFDVYDETMTLSLDGCTFDFELKPHSDAASQQVSEDTVIAPMPGKVVSVAVAPGQTVKKGEIVMVLEAMKMQMELTVSRDGVVHAVHARAEDQVKGKQPLVELAPEEES